MRDTTRKGDVVELQVAVALMSAGKAVLRPLSAGLRYNLVVEDGHGHFGHFMRVQCKSGVVREGRIEFRVYSSDGRGGRPITSHGQIDAFGVYSPHTREACLVPIDAVEACGAVASLRIQPARNGQTRGIRSATDFVVREATIKR